MIAKRIPDAAPEVKRRALAYVLSFFFAFFILTMTVALYRVRCKKKSEQFETRIYFQAEPFVSPVKTRTAPSTPVKSRSTANRSSIYDSLKPSRFSAMLSSPLKTPTRPPRAQTLDKTPSACPQQCLGCLAQDVDTLSFSDSPHYLQDGRRTPTPLTPTFHRRSSSSYFA